VYTILNLVDEVTQWEIVVCVEGISEYFLIPALEKALTEFPFKILNFHSDNGSDIFNYQVADLLERLIVNKPSPEAAIATTTVWPRLKTDYPQMERATAIFQKVCSGNTNWYESHF